MQRTEQEWVASDGASLFTRRWVPDHHDPESGRILDEVVGWLQDVRRA